MSKQRYIDTKFWDDNAILKFDPIEKLIFIYLLTNALTNIAGIYEISVRRISFDTGIDSEMVTTILSRFEKLKKIYYINGWVIICNFPKFQKYEESPKIRKGIEVILSQIPNEIKQSIDTLSIPYLYPLNYSNSNSNSNSNTNSNIHTAKAVRVRSANQILLGNIVDFYKQRNNSDGQFARYARDAKELILLARRDLPEADETKIEAEVQARINLVAKELESKNLSWSLSAVIKNWSKCLTY